MLRDTLRAVLLAQRPPAVPPPEVDRVISHRLPPADPHYALVLTGVRRSGKSTLQSQLMRGQPGSLYINLEDTRLYDLSVEDFPVLMELMEELADGRPLFLDEVQEVPEWQRLVRSLIDRGHLLCLTGSTASLLGREMGAKLTGRHRSFEVFPFSYREFLAYTGGQANATSLADYLDRGGFPAYLRRREPVVLQQLLRDVVERDIVQRHHLRESRHLMNLALFLLANTGQPLSFQNLTKALAVPTVGQTSRYVEFLQDAYLLFAVPKYSSSFKQRVVAPAKYYAIDNGLRRVNSPNFTSDVGHRLENAVALALRQRGQPVWYAGEKNVWECDFVTETEVFQVCTELTEANKKREIEGLVRACALGGDRRAVIVTLNQRDQISGDIPITVVPGWEWLRDA